MQALEPDKDGSSGMISINSITTEMVPPQIEENSSVPILDNSCLDISFKEPNEVDGTIDQPLISAESLDDDFEPYLPLRSSDSDFPPYMVQDKNDTPLCDVSITDTEPIQDQRMEVEETTELAEPIQDQAMELGETTEHESEAMDVKDQGYIDSQEINRNSVNFEVEEPIIIKIEPNMIEEAPPEASIEETVTCQDDILKLDASSEDEEINFYLKSGAESSSSKEESPTGPGCSGTSRTGINSLSESEEDLPNVNIPLPIKKRKRETLVETITSSSCSEDEVIDYANLKPEEIKALIEEARRYGSIKRKCKCPKKKWSELPVKGPIEPSGRCTIGKGDWSEKLSVPCAACSAGACQENHRHGRRRRKGPLPRMSLLTKSRAKATIGEDVPIIELSDTEEVSPTSYKVSPEVTISALPRSGECIILSSSSDDDDVVCEGVIKTEVKNVGMELPLQSSGALGPTGSPDVVVLNASLTPDVSTNGIPAFRAGHFSNSPHMALSPPILPAPIPEVHDAEPWPDCNIDLENWDETFNFLANIAGPGGLEPEVNISVVAPERPPTPEGWSCPICLEPKTGVNEIMSTTCGHVFCGNCIRSAVKLHKKCPTCRKKLTPKQFHKIFL